MDKYKSTVKKIAAAVKPKKLNIAGNRKRAAIVLAAVVIVLALIGAGLYAFVFNKSDDANKAATTTPDYNSLGSTSDPSDCRKDIESLSKYDTSAETEDTAKILNWRGLCYKTSKEYDKAIAEFERMKPICEKLNDARCMRLADNHLAQVKNAKDNPSSLPNAPKTRESDLTPEYREELNKPEVPDDDDGR